jgi:hypothetical protein
MNPGFDGFATPNKFCGSGEGKPWLITNEQWLRRPALTHLPEFAGDDCVRPRFKGRLQMPRILDKHEIASGSARDAGHARYFHRIIANDSAFQNFSDLSQRPSHGTFL